MSTGAFGYVFPMYYLLEFIRKNHYVLLFIVLEVASFVMLFRFNSYQGSVWLSSANSVVAEVNRWYSDVISYIGLRDVNRRLTDENVRLQIETNRLRQALAAATGKPSETEILIREKLENYKLIPATVVSNDLAHDNHYLVIDRGTNDGVSPEMGVVGGGGIVGIVYLTGPNFSLVIPVTNKKSSISCRIRHQNYFGYLQWEGSNLLHAYVDDIPRYAHVKKGEVVETSGYSSVFPPGIFVGRITEVRNSADGQSYKLDVTLGTDFARLRDVNVIATPYKAEIDTLRSHAAEAESSMGN